MTKLREANRHRPSEPFSPRPTDLLADRLRVLAALVRRRDLRFTVGAIDLDADALDRIVAAQITAESELTLLWTRFRQYYGAYTDVLAERRALLEAAVEWVEDNDPVPETKRAMRLCRLRRPSVAKVRAVVEGRRETGT